MAFPANVWNQIKNLTADDLIAALRRDGWEHDPSSKGATLAFIKKINTSHLRVVIHYHPKKNYGPGLLKDLIEDIGWSESDLRRLKLIK